jgi:hypothetical protein
MKQLFVLCLAAVMASGLNVAQAAPNGYVGIFAEETHSAWCASGTVPYEIDMWVYLILGDGGAAAFSFNLTVPPNVQMGDLTVADSGDPFICMPPYCPTGIYGSFGLCLAPPRFSWIWLAHGTLTVVSDSPGILEIHAPSLYTYNCAGDVEVPRILTNLFINYDPSDPVCAGMAVRSTTWGAIKSIYVGN